MRTRIAIGFAAAIGLSALARTAAYYQRQDTLSLALVAIMTAVFVAGVVELLQRAARAARLAGEIAALPVPASQATIDGASPPVRALLRARVAQVPSAAPPAPLAAYLVGLLVMLGLLGTFLGLLETLRGAREALATSGDIEALRAGLSLPMQGLTRSFGTSAAGVSASAMLGLAATFARRSEARLAQAASAYASEALAPLTLGHRQLAALERIAQQGDALPEASRALSAAVESVRAELAGAIDRSAQEASRVLTPLVERTVEGAVAAATRHVAEVRAELEGDRASRRAAEAAHDARAEESRAQLAAREDARAERLAARWSDATSSLRASVDAVSRALDEAQRAQIARDEARDVALAATTDRITRAVSDAIDAATRRMSAAGDRDEARGAALDRLVAAMDAQRAALATYAAELAERLAAHAEATQAGAARSADVVRDAAALVHAGGAEMTAVAEMFAGAVDRHRDAATAWLESLGAVEAAMDQASESIAARGFGEQLDRARELFDVQLQFHRELLVQLRAGARANGGSVPRLDADDAERERTAGDAPA